MSVWLIILLTVVAVITILLVAALFLPKHYSVTVSETINQPRYFVYAYVSLFNNQMQYSEWLRADPELSPTVTGEDGKVGAILRWESHNRDKNKNVGTGEQEIVKMDSNTIELELRFIKPLEATCKLVNNFIEPAPGITQYTCTFYGYAKFPVNLPNYLIGRRIIKKTQQKILRNIKAIVEQRA